MNQTPDPLHVRIDQAGMITVNDAPMAGIDAYGEHMEQLVARQEFPTLQLHGEGNNYEAVGKVIYRTIRAGYPESKIEHAGAKS